MTPISFAEGSLPKSLPHSSHSSRLKLIAHAEEKLNPLTSLPKWGNINRKGFSAALAARQGLVCAPWQRQRLPARPACAAWHRQPDCGASAAQPAACRTSALSSRAFLLLKVVLLPGLGDLGSFLSFFFLFLFFPLIFFLLLLFLFAVVTYFYSQSWMQLLDSAVQVFMNKLHRLEISRHSKVTELPLWLNVLFNGWGMYSKYKRGSMIIFWRGTKIVRGRGR